MKTSTTTPRTSRKTTKTTPANATEPKARKTRATPAAAKVAAPRVRRSAPRKAKGAAAAVLPSEDAVRFRAYEIYLNRNGYGDEVSDWLQAEQELFSTAG